MARQSGRRASTSKRWSIEEALALVGLQVQVYWPLDKVYYPGVIEGYDEASDRHRVLYEDGVVEVLNLHKEKWELVKDKEKEEEEGQKVRGSSEAGEVLQSSEKVDDGSERTRAQEMTSPPSEKLPVAGGSKDAAKGTRDQADDVPKGLNQDKVEATEALPSKRRRVPKRPKGASPEPILPNKSDTRGLSKRPPLGSKEDSSHPIGTEQGLKRKRSGGRKDETNKFSADEETPGGGNCHKTERPATVQQLGESAASSEAVTSNGDMQHSLGGLVSPVKKKRGPRSARKTVVSAVGDDATHLEPHEGACSSPPGSAVCHPDSPDLGLEEQRVAEGVDSGTGAVASVSLGNGEAQHCDDHPLMTWETDVASRDPPQDPASHGDALTQSTLVQGLVSPGHTGNTAGSGRSLTAGSVSELAGGVACAVAPEGEALAVSSSPDATPSVKMTSNIPLDPQTEVEGIQNQQHQVHAPGEPSPDGVDPGAATIDGGTEPSERVDDILPPSDAGQAEEWRRRVVDMASEEQQRNEMDGRRRKRQAKKAKQTDAETSKEGPGQSSVFSSKLVRSWVKSNVYFRTLGPAKDSTQIKEHAHSATDGPGSSEHLLGGAAEVPSGCNKQGGAGGVDDGQVGLDHLASVGGEAPVLFVQEHACTTLPGHVNDGGQGALTTPEQEGQDAQPGLPLPSSPGSSPAPSTSSGDRAGLALGSPHPGTAVCAEGPHGGSDTAGVKSLLLNVTEGGQVPGPDQTAKVGKCKPDTDPIPVSSQLPLTGCSPAMQVSSTSLSEADCLQLFWAFRGGSKQDGGGPGLKGLSVEERETQVTPHKEAGGGCLIEGEADCDPEAAVDMVSSDQAMPENDGEALVECPSLATSAPVLVIQVNESSVQEVQRGQCPHNTRELEPLGVSAQNSQSEQGTPALGPAAQEVPTLQETVILSGGTSPMERDAADVQPGDSLTLLVKPLTPSALEGLVGSTEVPVAVAEVVSSGGEALADHVDSLATSSEPHVEEERSSERCEVGKRVEGSSQQVHLEEGTVQLGEVCEHLVVLPDVPASSLAPQGQGPQMCVQDIAQLVTSTSESPPDTSMQVGERMSVISSDPVGDPESACNPVTGPKDSLALTETGSHEEHGCLGKMVTKTEVGGEGGPQPGDAGVDPHLLLVEGKADGGEMMDAMEDVSEDGATSGSDEEWWECQDAGSEDEEEEEEEKEEEEEEEEEDKGVENLGVVAVPPCGIAEVEAERTSIPLSITSIPLKTSLVEDGHSETAQVGEDVAPSGSALIHDRGQENIASPPTCNIALEGQPLAEGSGPEGAWKVVGGENGGEVVAMAPVGEAVCENPYAAIPELVDGARDDAEGTETMVDPGATQGVTEDLMVGLIRNEGSITAVEKGVNDSTKSSPDNDLSGELEAPGGLVSGVVVPTTKEVAGGREDPSHEELDDVGAATEVEAVKDGGSASEKDQEVQDEDATEEGPEPNAQGIHKGGMQDSDPECTAGVEQQDGLDVYVSDDDDSCLDGVDEEVLRLFEDVDEVGDSADDVTNAAPPEGEVMADVVGDVQDAPLPPATSGSQVTELQDSSGFMSGGDPSTDVKTPRDADTGTEVAIGFADLFTSRRSAMAESPAVAGPGPEGQGHSPGSSALISDEEMSDLDDEMDTNGFQRVGKECHEGADQKLGATMDSVVTDRKGISPTSGGRMSVTQAGQATGQGCLVDPPLEASRGARGGDVVDLKITETEPSCLEVGATGAGKEAGAGRANSPKLPEDAPSTHEVSMVEPSSRQPCTHGPVGDEAGEPGPEPLTSASSLPYPTLLPIIVQMISTASCLASQGKHFEAGHLLGCAGSCLTSLSAEVLASLPAGGPMRPEGGDPGEATLPDGNPPGSVPLLQAGPPQDMPGMATLGMHGVASGPPPGPLFHGFVPTFNIPACAGSMDIPHTSTGVGVVPDSLDCSQSSEVLLGTKRPHDSQVNKDSKGECQTSRKRGKSSCQAPWDPTSTQGPPVSVQSAWSGLASSFPGAMSAVMDPVTLSRCLLGWNTGTLPQHEGPPPPAGSSLRLLEALPAPTLAAAPRAQANMMMNFSDHISPTSAGGPTAAPCGFHVEAETPTTQNSHPSTPWGPPLMLTSNPIPSLLLPVAVESLVRDPRRLG